MATTIRVSDKNRRRLEEVRAELILETGRKKSLDDVIGALVTRPAHRPRASPPEDEGPNLTPEQWKAIFALPSPWKKQTRVEEIDDVVYGDPHGEGRA